MLLTLRSRCILVRHILSLRKIGNPILLNSDMATLLTIVLVKHLPNPTFHARIDPLVTHADGSTSQLVLLWSQKVSLSLYISLKQSKYDMCQNSPPFIYGDCVCNVHFCNVQAVIPLHYSDISVSQVTRIGVTSTYAEGTLRDGL